MSNIFFKCLQGFCLCLAVATVKKSKYEYQSEQACFMFNILLTQFGQNQKTLE